MRLLLSTVLLLVLLQAEGASRPNAFTRGVPSVKGVLAQKAFVVLRGGSDDDDDEIDELIEELLEEQDSDGEDTDDEEEEEEEKVDPKLTKAAIKSTSKAKTKKTTAAKKKVSAKLKSTPSKAAPLKATPVSKSKPKKKGKSLMQVLKVPYILRACMNPFTVFAMTKAYFASLFNFNYLKEDNTQNLRSAMEEKAKKSGGSTGRKKGKRQMRPGQAKTLSDLPVLSA
mmetsp:Transcript_22774/g.37721  ORF Transcript_22774/g.37721 Transcript_22774/m.37721 type:complete len:227 (-) Transcript_22774:282-962(-)|eukprot:CAMPEP_0119015516 /NCGR_PEP_ID=MMETSP1176-20130426/11169_1 /TAXON_ID=265551 /ORGANISM="Synedropsis recta cf, Strain CCMP1620" /LENGTH=226 /DNA_ID=CAMNT_0006968815 /DNA_START=24 /DNA_END=704 /DNA_ORIENTATION=+